MNRDALQQRVRTLLLTLMDVRMALEQLQNAPAWDEDYKVEADARLSAELFDEAQVLADELALICSLEAKPPEPVELGELGVDGLVVGGLAFASAMLGSSAARAGLAGAAFELTRRQLERSTAPTEPPPAPRCPRCGATEVESATPRTVYACGSSDYDQKPDTFEGDCG